MNRSIRRHLRAALSKLTWPEVDAVITLPRAATTVVPRWRPSPDHIEAWTATVWAKPIGDDTAEAVVILGDEMVTGPVAVQDVTRLGGLCDKPHRIGWLSTAPVTHKLNIGHPALRYQHWHRKSEKDLRDMVRQLRYARGLRPAWSAVNVMMTPADLMEIVIPVEILGGGPGALGGHASVLGALLAECGPGARLRFYPHEVAREPLHDEAHRLLNAGVAVIASA